MLRRGLGTGRTAGAPSVQCVPPRAHPPRSDGPLYNVVYQGVLDLYRESYKNCMLRRGLGTGQTFRVCPSTTSSPPWCPTNREQLQRF